VGIRLVVTDFAVVGDDKWNIRLQTRPKGKNCHSC